jgi:hypothetical protein
MSITYTDAQTYTARVLGASGDNVQLAAAADSIKAAIQEWNLRHDFSYLLMDTSGGFTVATCTQTLGTTLTTTVTNGFAGVNIGQTAVGATIGTVTVTAIVSTTVLTVMGGSNAGPETMTFSADIPVISGTDTYNLPSPIGRPYSARLLTNEWTLEFKEQRNIDRSFVSQTPASTPFYYNLFNTGSFSTGRQNGKIRLFPIPGNTDTLRVRYFRPIAEPSAGGDNLDVPDTYVYALLDLARYMFLRDHDSESQRLQELKERAEIQFRAVVARDEQGTEDNDMALIPQMEHRPLRGLDPDDIRFMI